MSNRAKFWILVGLMLSNVIVGVVGLRALAKLERNYSELVARGLPVLDNLRAMTRDLSVIQRAALRAVLTNNQAERADQIGRLREARLKLTRHESALNSGSFFDEATLHSLQSSRRRYDEATAIVLREIDLGNPDAARIQREQMRGAYDDLLDQLDSMAEVTVRSGKTLSQQYSGEAQRFTHLLIALSGWPLAVMGVGLLFALALGVFLLFAYRAVGTPEQP